MAKFKAKVEITVKYEYEIEFEALNYRDGEMKAIYDWREQVPGLAAVDENRCEFEVELDQLTAECPKCGTEHLIHSNDLRVFMDQHPRENRQMVTHILLDGVKVPCPWYDEDYEICADCGRKIDAGELSI